MADGITNSPNMGLPVPTQGVTPGPEWFQSIVQSLLIIDQHNHSTGEGVQISGGGIGLSSTLPFNNNTATTVKAIEFTAQSSLSDLLSLYTIGADLYFNDGNGNIVKVTSGGAVNATSSGISSGNATASFVASVLVVNAASNTPANIQGASILLGNSSAGTHYVTLNPPNSLAADYSLYLPASLPGSTQFLTLSAAGNIAASGGVDGTTLTSSGGVMSVAPVNKGVSGSSGSFTRTLNTFAPVVTTGSFTTVGRPVQVALMPDGSTTTPAAAYLQSGATGEMYIQILRDSTVVAMFVFPPIAGSIGIFSPSSVSFLDDGVTAGNHTYSVQMRSSNGASAVIFNCMLKAYEIP